MSIRGFGDDSPHFNLVILSVHTRCGLYHVSAKTVKCVKNVGVFLLWHF